MADHMKSGISIGEGILWVLLWLVFMLLYTFLDIAVWRKLLPEKSKYLNLLCIVSCMAAYLTLLKEKGHFQINLLGSASSSGLLLALGCAVMLYFLLDRCLDPILERLFPASEESYQETLRSLGKAPVISILQVCVLAPVMEEILMRAFLLGGLSVNYGKGTALAISSLVFALLHFNMVQTLSALICGVILGLLYLKTDSLLCCIVTHMGYNLISCLTTVLPFFKAK